MRVRSKRSDGGFVLIAMSVAMILMLAVIGLAFDLGRIYIARNEAQVFADSAAMTAAKNLDGTAQGLAHARAAVARLPMRWNLGTEPFTDVMIEFSADGNHWERDPKEPGDITMTRVTVPANHVSIVFLRAAGGPASLAVAAQSAASVNPVRLTE